MNVMTWIDKQNNGSPPGRPGLYRRTRTLPVASETRAPPTRPGCNNDNDGLLQQQ